MTETLLEVRNLSASFLIEEHRVPAIEDVSFAVPHGTTVALVGESGCGKSITALSILGLLPHPGRIDRGQIVFEGRDLLTLEEAEFRRMRGRRISMIFQEPMTALNPIYSIGAQISEAVRLHQSLNRRAARARTLELLNAVGIPAPEQRVHSYPHELSGGMRQRVVIAMALACSPDLLIADEPTTALDVTIQAQILELLASLQRRFRMSVLLITHDLGIVAQHAERMVVMYAGRVVEAGLVSQIFEEPKHPYTAGLLASIPARALAVSRVAARQRLPTIEGAVPTGSQLPNGCKFAERCDRIRKREISASRCLSEEPALQPLTDGRTARCHFPLEVPLAP